jgi:hypothetical protein
VPDRGAARAQPALFDTVHAQLSHAWTLPGVLNICQGNLMCSSQPGAVMAPLTRWGPGEPAGDAGLRSNGAQQVWSEWVNGPFRKIATTRSPVTAILTVTDTGAVQLDITTVHAARIALLPGVQQVLVVPPSTRATAVAAEAVAQAVGTIGQLFVQRELPRLRRLGTSNVAWNSQWEGTAACGVTAISMISLPPGATFRSQGLDWLPTVWGLELAMGQPDPEPEGSPDWLTAYAWKILREGARGPHPAPPHHAPAT